MGELQEMSEEETLGSPIGYPFHNTDVKALLKNIEHLRDEVRKNSLAMARLQKSDSNAINDLLYDMKNLWKELERIQERKCDVVVDV